MDPKDIAVGNIYTLTEDVANPQADRRVKRDWREAPVWKSGSRFVCLDKHGGFPELFFLSGNLYGMPLSGRRFEDSPLFAKLALSSPKDANEVILSQPWLLQFSRSYVLEKLYETGVVSADQIKAALGQIRGEDDGEDR